MKTQKFSRQREAIKDYLMQCKNHPTADTIYANIRNEIPNISLGTVYRNLNLLVQNSEVIKLSSKDGKDRYDANLEDHYHFICDKCGCIEDVFVENLIDVETVSKFNNNFKISSYEINFMGICEKCLNIEKSN